MGKKIALVFLMILLIGGFIGLVLYINKQTNQEASRGLAIEQETRPLRLEEAEITSRLNELKDTYERLMYGSGTLTLLFNTPDEQIYSVIHPILSEHKYYGTIALSDTQYPGKEGYMSMAQFKELLSAGWSYCIKWTGSVDSLLKVRKLLLAQGIEQTATVYFPNGTYDESFDSELLENDFTVAIHHGENDLAREVYDSGSGIWRPGAVIWRSGRRTLQNVVMGYGGIIFEISFQDDDYAYVESAFSSMLSIIEEYGDTLLVTSPERARSYRLEKGQTKETVRLQWEQERTGLESQLREIREQIYIIEEKYADS